MKNNLALVAIVLVLAAVGYGAYSYSNNKSPSQSGAARDHKNATYMIDGQPVTLVNGVAEVDAAPGSASKVTTKYFGNELKTDLNNDGKEDVVFLVTQQTGGSGTFYYAVAALKTDNGYSGSDGYPLGDRIAPQTTEISKNPNHKNVIVVNYADRAPGEPMTAQPSVGKSVYLKLDQASMRWGIVEPNFEGESNTGAKINIDAVCQGALAYMSFPDAAHADAFVAECKAGRHPEVIEQYKQQIGAGDGAAI